MDRALDRRRLSHTHINRFPPEVLGRILFFCLPYIAELARDDADRFADVERDIWLISHPNVTRYLLELVCTKWRSVILTTPQMWSKFFLEDDTLQLLRTKAYTVRTWLERSGQIPLDLYLDTSREPDSTVRRVFVDMFAPEASRIRNLSLNLAIEFKRFIPSLLEALQFAPLLESLHVRWDMSLELRNKTYHAPRLTKLSLLLEATEFIFALTRESLGIIRYLTLFIGPASTKPISAYLVCLVDCIRLEELWVGSTILSTERWSRMSNNHPITLTIPSLKRLKIRATPSIQAATLQALILPNLELLFCTDVPYPLIEGPYTFLPRLKAIKHENAMLNELYIKSLTAEDLIESAPLVPNVAVLCLSGTCETLLQIFAALFPLDSTPPFPLLHTLRVFIWECRTDSNNTGHHCGDFLVQYVDRFSFGWPQIRHLLVPGTERMLTLHVGYESYESMTHHTLFEQAMLHGPSFKYMAMPALDNFENLFFDTQ